MKKTINNKGKNNPNYKDGRTIKEYFCIDCKKKLNKSAYFNKYLKYGE